MKNFFAILKKGRSIIGIDRAISYSLFSKIFSAAFQPVMFYSIARFLSPIEQGYYYTFYSILSLNVFLELGLGVVITHFSSNEYANLQWSGLGTILGDDASLSRLFSMVNKSIKWYSVISILEGIVLIPVGLIFFKTNAGLTPFQYSIPWILLILASATGNCLIPIISVLSGCARVTDLQRIRLIQNILSTLFFCGSLALGMKLYSAAILQFTQSICFLIWFIKSFPGLIGQLKSFQNEQTRDQISWRREILPMQWRVALSWLSSYFMGYVFNPLLFSYRNPVEAGQMGMSRNLVDTTTNAGMPWISTRSVTYGSFVKRRQFKELDRAAIQNTLQALAVTITVSLGVTIILILAKHFYPTYGNRVLSLPAFILLSVAGIAGVIIYSFGEYLRAHKQEPFLFVNLGLAGLITISNFITARFYNAEIMAMAYSLIIIFIGLPISFLVFREKRRRWHGGDTCEAKETVRETVQ
ncbi:MAG: hypothetical protein PHQ40_01000 [Anaerolineaceae bacterium]|nr:hypothetical protein [Anaerolineaceae bacterium]